MFSNRSNIHCRYPMCGIVAGHWNSLTNIAIVPTNSSHTHTHYTAVLLIWANRFFVAAKYSFPSIVSISSLHAHLQIFLFIHIFFLHVSIYLVLCVHTKRRNKNEFACKCLNFFFSRILQLFFMAPKWKTKIGRLAATALCGMRSEQKTKTFFFFYLLSR